MRDLRRVDTVVYKGGGMAGLIEGGAWETVKRELDVQGATVTTFGGTSAGAIIALLCSLGVPLQKTMESTPWAKFMPNRWGVIRDFWAALTTGAYSDLTFAEAWIRARIEEGGLYPDLTFADLLRFRSVSLKVVATNEETMRPELFSPQTTPDVEVAMAVLGSMAIPGVWPSVHIKAAPHFGTPYCDGGAWANLPLRMVADHLEAEQVIGFAVDSPDAGKLAPYRRNGIRRARRLLQALMNGQQVHQPSHLYPDRVVFGPRPAWAHATAFDLTKKQQAVLWALGSTAAGKWMRADEKS